MSVEITNPYQYFSDIDGTPLEGGYVNVGVSGLNPLTNPVSVFADALLTVPLAQPLRTVSGYIVNNGSPTNIYIAESDYSITVRNVNLTTVFTALSNEAVTTPDLANSVAAYADLLALNPEIYPVGHVVTVTNSGISGEFVVKSGIGSNNNGTIISNITWAGETKYWERLNNSGTLNVKWFGAIGNNVADDTASIQAAITAAPNATIIFFPSGTYKCTAQISISGKERIQLVGEKSKILFTDGSYIGILITAASYQCNIENLYIFGTNTTTPAITLVKVTGGSAYFSATKCGFAYASAAIMLASTYIVKLTNNEYSNCDRYIYAITGEGATADLGIQNETFGTSTIGTNPVVDLQFIQPRVTNCYFETQQHTKESIRVRSECQRATLNANTFEESGGIVIGTNLNVSMTGNHFKNAQTGNYCIFVTAGTSLCVTGGMILFSVKTAGEYGIYSNGFLTCTGLVISKADTGIRLNSSGALTGNSIDSCTDGIYIGAGATAVTVGLNSLQVNSSNDINNANGGPNIIVFNYATNISDVANNGTMMGNSPKRAFMKSVLKGNTGSRPTLDASFTGVMYMDTTLDADGKPIWWNGTAWVDATGGVV